MRLTQRRTITSTHWTTSTCPGPPDTTGSDFKGPGIEMMDIKILNGSCRMHVYVLQNIVRTWSSEKGNSMNLLIPQNHTLPGRIYIFFPKYVLQEKKILYIDPWLSSLNENWVKPVPQNHEDNKSLKERILSSLELFSLMRLDSIAI